MRKNIKAVKTRSDENKWKKVLPPMSKSLDDDTHILLGLKAYKVEGVREDEAAQR